MMEDLKNQSERFGTDVRFGMVTKVALSDEVGVFRDVASSRPHGRLVLDLSALVV
jgi:thioredoxin reductase (NADPH)